MFNKRKLDVSFNYRNSTTKERELCTTCRALIGFLNSIIKYDINNIDCEVTINVWKDHKPNVSCSAKKSNLSPKINFLHKCNQLNLKNFTLSTRKEKIFGS